MSFGPKSPPMPNLAEAGPPPANPPMFGSDAAGQRVKSSARKAKGYGSTILGAAGAPAPTTANKTLLGE